MKSNKYLLAYFGHHKCATQYVNSIIRQVCRNIGLKFISVHNPQMFNNNLRKYVDESDIDFIAYINANYCYAGLLNNYKGFHVVRDPMDIVVSAYFSHLYSHPTSEWPQLEEFRKNLKQLSKDDGLILEMSFRKNQFEQMYNWNYTLPIVLEIKMEVLTANPNNIFLEIFQFIGFKDESINKVLSQAIQDNQFSKLAGGRKPGEEDVKNHYRKGLAGDWINHFSKRHIDFFKEHYNDLLIKLGYERGYNW